MAVVPPPFQAFPPIFLVSFFLPDFALFIFILFLLQCCLSPRLKEDEWQRLNSHCWIFRLALLLFHSVFPLYAAFSPVFSVGLSARG